MFSTQCTCNAWRTRVETTTIKGQRNLIISLRNCQRERSSKMPRLSAADRNIAIGRLEAGESQSAVARHFNVHHTTINRLWHRYNQFNSTNDRPRSGRPRVTTPAQDRFIRLFHLRHRFAVATATAGQVPGLRRISEQTIRNRLREAGIRPYRPKVGPALRPQHRQRRVQWCNTVRRWNQVNWRCIWFSDESHFLLERRRGRHRVYRRRRERFAPNCVRHVDRYGGGSVMVWGAMSYNGRSELVVVQGNLTANRYINQILRPHLLPILNHQRELFQHDNARPHTARATRDYLTNQNVNVLPWPSKSPDLNPIEHLWDELGRRVRQRQQPPLTLAQLANALQDEWRRIPQAKIRRLVQSMPRRCRAVAAARGGVTKY